MPPSPSCIAGAPSIRSTAKAVIAAGGWTLLYLSGLSLSGAATAKELPGKWIEAVSPHFRVLSNASESETRRTAEHFEKIRHAYGQALPSAALSDPRRLTVFAPRDDRSMKRLLPSFWRSRTGTRPAGAFLSRPTVDRIVLRADLVRKGHLELVYHEYFHYLARQAGWRAPLWLTEGLADFWGSAVVHDDRVDVGLPQAYRVGEIREGALIPLEELFAVDRRSPYYGRSGKSGMFYAESWALTHYLMAGDPEMEGRRRLARYLELYDDGVDSLAAAREAFGDLNELYKKLGSYRHSPTLTYLKIPTGEAAEVRVETRFLSPAQAAAEAARLLAESDERDEALDLLETAADGAAGEVATLMARGLLALRDGDGDAARASLDAALAAAPDEAAAHYALAVLDFRHGVAPPDPAAVEQHLAAAVRLVPMFAAARARLAELYRVTEPASEKALRMIRSAQQAQPDELLLELKEAQILDALGRPEEASTAARDAAAQALAQADAVSGNNVCWKGTLWGFGNLVLDVCEKAHALEPELYGVTDSLALAYARAGRLEEAAETFRLALSQDGAGADEDFVRRRTAWVQRLAAGEDPFAELSEAELMAEISGADLDWGL